MFLNFYPTFQGPMITLKTLFLNAVFWYLYLAVISLQFEEKFPVVEFPEGKVRGFTVLLENTGVSEDTRIRNADIFLAIPYAQPPIDELRLEVYNNQLLNYT